MRARHDNWDAGRWGERDDRERVLIEDADDARSAADLAALREAGFDARRCGGPATMGHRDCPLVNGAGCHLAAGCDAIISQLDLADPACVAVAVRLQLRYPRTPLVMGSRHPSPGVVTRAVRALKSRETIENQYDPIG
jgi:hypothetical protein